MSVAKLFAEYIKDKFDEFPKCKKMLMEAKDTKSVVKIFDEMATVPRINMFCKLHKDLGRLSFEDIREEF